MANLQFDKEITALFVIDPYNDFIPEGGKVWDRLKTVAEANDCIPLALPLRSHAVGRSSAQSVGMQSIGEPMFATEP
jgi:hypothetical protein